MRRATRTIAPLFTALLLAIAGVTFIAAPAQANIGTEYHGGFWYTDTDNNTVTVSAVEPSVTGSNPVIPASVVMSDGNVYTVTSIADHGMKNRGLTGVTIPASVTALGPTALEANAGLKKVLFLGNAPTIISDAGTANESIDTANAAMRVHYSSGSSGFTTPTWHGYKTVPHISVSTLPSLKDAMFFCTGEVVVQLAADVIGDNTARFDVDPLDGTCNAELDLNSYDLTLRHIVIGAGSRLTIDDTSAGTPGVVTASTTGVNEAAIQHDAGATLVIEGGEIHASSKFGAGIGGANNRGGGTLTVNGGTITATSNAGAGIGGGDNGAGGTITINGGTVTASSVLGAGIGGGSAGDGGTVTIGDGADVTANGFSAIGAGQSAVPFGVLTVAGTLRIPTGVLNVSNLTFGPEITVTSTGTITGLDASPTVGAQIQGLASTGTIDNGGSITLASNLLSGILMFDHNYRLTFDSQGGSAEPPVTVYAPSFDNGARTLPTPTRAGYTFGGWYTATNGGGTKIEAATTLTGSSTDGNAVESTLYAKWSATAPILTGDPTTTGQVGSSFSYTPTLQGEPDITVTLTSGTLPAGLTLNPSTGAITGTPSAGSVGTYALTLTADNDIEPNAVLAVTITINEQATLTGPGTASGEVGQAFSYVPTALGGFPAPTVTLTTGTLPGGLSLSSSTGAITGTPSAFGSFPITLTATNGVGTDPTLDVQISISPEPLVGLTPTVVGSAREGQTLTADEGPVTPASATFTYQWRRNAGPIPGATHKTYVPTRADLGRKLSVTITATSPGVDDVTATSVSTPLVYSTSARLYVTPTTVKKGTSFSLVATGLKPRQRYNIWLGGKKTYVGTADSHGMVVRTVKFKTSIKPGTRRVRVSGYTKSKRTFTIYTHVKYRK